MQERYLYRGKRIDNGEWVEGNLITDEMDDSKYFIGYMMETDEDGFPHDFDVVQVDPSTLCQCTSFEDRFQKLIFEKDIVRHYNNAARPNSYSLGVVLWDDLRAGFYRTENKYPADKPRIIRECIYEVIGNIFDNPELLEKQNDNMQT